MPRVEAIRRLFEVDARTDGTPRRDPDPMGQRHRRLRGRKRRARQHT